MMDSITEIKSVDSKASNRLNLIIDSKFLTLTGPWHFDDDVAIARIDLNEIKADFNYLINVMGCNNLLHPDDYHYSKDLLRELEAGRSVDYHFKVITPEAEIKHIHGYGSLLSNDFLQARILNKEELAEASAVKTDDSFQLQAFILDALPQMVWVYDVKTKQSLFNDSWYNYTGMTPEQCQRFDHQKSDVFHPSQQPELKHKWDEYIATGKAYKGETLIRDFNGAYRWHEEKCIPVKNQSGEIVKWIGTFTDVHEQFTIEKKLNEHTTLLEAIVHSSSNGIEVLDAVHEPETNEVTDFIWRYHNGIISRIHGIGELTGKQFGETYSAKLKREMLVKMKEVMRTGTPLRFEQAHHVGRDYTRWLDISMVKLEDSIIINTYDITEKKIAEIELQKSKQFIHQISNCIPGVIYVFDVLTGNFIYASKKIAPIFGINEASVYVDATSVFTKVLHPDDFGKRMHYVQELKTIAKDETREVEVRLKVSDGTWHWFRISDTLFKQKDDGSAWLTIGFVEDINDAKAADAKIMLQQQRTRHAEKITGTASWYWDITSGEVIWSDNLFHLLGYEPRACLPCLKTFLRHTHSIDKAALLQLFRNIDALAEGALPACNFSVIKRDGRICHWHATSELIMDNGDRKVIGTVRDTTDHVLMQQTLTAKNSFIERLTEYTVDRIVVIDTNYMITAWNKSCENFYGLKRADALGKHLFHAFPEISKNPFLIEQYRRAVKGEILQLSNIHQAFYDGYYEACLIPLTDTDGQVSGVLTIFHDVTEAVKGKRQVQSLNDALQEKNTALKSLQNELDTFTFIASNDLREPLRKIQMASKLLIDSEINNLSEKGIKNFQEMTTAVTRISSLIDDILVFLRATTGTWNAEPVDLNEVLENLLYEMRVKIKETNAVIEYDKLPVFKCNQLQMAELFQNFLVNALKFQRAGVAPRVKISSAFLYGSEIDKRIINSEKQYLTIKVADNGIGFDQQYAERIFQMFQRLDNAENFPGTGIGLAICKKVVDNHHGFIVAKSKPNEGAVFICYFPVL